jgi:hypothetical protein
LLITLVRSFSVRSQLEINTKLLPPLESAEQADQAQFGNVCIAAKRDGLKAKQTDRTCKPRRY